MCGCTQTAFIYWFDLKNKKVFPAEPFTNSFEPGFVCVWKDCQSIVKGLEYYEASESTVGKKSSFDRGNL